MKKAKTEKETDTAETTCYCPSGIFIVIQVRSSITK